MPRTGEVENMDEPELPAMTQAEQDLVDRYLRVVDLVGRVNPARDSGHFSVRGGVNAAQALVSASRELLHAAETMVERGETEVYAPVLRRAMLMLDSGRRTRRVVVEEADG